jgi:surfeit locus 1 family protein
VVTRPRLTARSITFLACAVLMATLFTRLGVWQLHRLATRRARNALIAARLVEPPRPLGAIPRDSAQAQYRRARVSGTYDFARQVVVVNRTHEGSPGVHIVTPLRPDSGVGGDTLVLVDRGWVYAPDGATVDLAGWREPVHVEGTGYVHEFARPRGSSAAVPGHADRLRWLDPAAVARATAVPIVPYYIVLDGRPAETTMHVPARDDAQPTLDDGPHLSYAIQWFAFAAIAVVGAAFAVFPRRPRLDLPPEA